MFQFIKSFVWGRYVLAHSWYLTKTGALDRKPLQPRIVIYHGISDKERTSFRWQLSFYCQNYQVVPLSQFVKDFDKAADKPLLAVTFDDAFLSVYEYAVDILDEFQIKPCIFVPVGFIEADNPKRYIKENLMMKSGDRSMNWDELRVCVKRGYEIGSHSWTHPNFGAKEVDYERELSDSKMKIEEKLGVEVNYFAFPFGGRKHFNQNALEAVRKSGYRRSFSGVREAVRENSLVIPRCYVNPSWGVNILRCILAGCYDTSGTRREGALL